MKSAGLQLLDSAFAVARDGELLSVHTPSRIESFLPELSMLPPAAWHVVVPSSYPPSQLSQLLTVAAAQGLDIVAFHDAAPLLNAALDIPDGSLMVELTEQHLCVVEVVADAGENRRRRVLQQPNAGYRELRRRWSELVAEAMVLKSRFDPLHDSTSEQRLLDSLPQALGDIAAVGRAEISINKANGEPCSVTLTRDQFAISVADIWRQLGALLREQRLMTSAKTILVDERDAALPGMREMLADFSACRVAVCPTGLAARHASLQAAVADASGGVPLRRGHSRVTALESIDALVLPLAKRHYRKPTHLLIDTRTVDLSAAIPLLMGRAVGDAGLQLADGLAGVSRLHCAILEREGELCVVNHSRYGTWLNDELVRGSARLSAGDRLRVGEPGVEINLIAVGSGNGAPPG